MKYFINKSTCWFFKVAVSVLGIWLAGTISAFAYIDPGSGSAILTVLVGIIVSIGVFFKSIWYKIKSIFRPSQREELDEKIVEKKQEGSKFPEKE